MNTTFKKQLNLKISQKPRSIIWYNSAAKKDRTYTDIRPAVKRVR
jgi:hypothetical protein